MTANPELCKSCRLLLGSPSPWEQHPIAGGDPVPHAHSTVPVLVMARAAPWRGSGVGQWDPTAVPGKGTGPRWGVLGGGTPHTHTSLAPTHSLQSRVAPCAWGSTGALVSRRRTWHQPGGEQGLPGPTAPRWSCCRFARCLQPRWPRRSQVSTSTARGSARAAAVPGEQRQQPRHGTARWERPSKRVIGPG